jgi:hypothetical protein
MRVLEVAGDQMPAGHDWAVVHDQSGYYCFLHEDRVTADVFVSACRGYHKLVGFAEQRLEGEQGLPATG